MNHNTLQIDYITKKFLRSILMLLILTSIGCNNQKRNLIRMPVEGKVIFDNKPLDRARIVFKSRTDNKTIVAVGTINQGIFHIPRTLGPTLGNSLVEIQSETMDLEEFEASRKLIQQRKISPVINKIPAKYNSASVLTAAISRDQSLNRFEFKLTSR